MIRKLKRWENKEGNEREVNYYYYVQGTSFHGIPKTLHAGATTAFAAEERTDSQQGETIRPKVTPLTLVLSFKSRPATPKSSFSHYITIERI